MVKVPADDPGVRQIGFDRGLCKECLFYREIVDLVEVRAPRPLAVDIDPARSTALVLGTWPSRRRATSSRGDRRRTLARRRAGRPVTGQRGAEHAALQDLRGGDDGRTAMAGPRMFLPMCLDRLDGRLDDDTIPVLPFRRARLALAPLRDRDRRARPRRLPARQLLFGRTDYAPPLAVVDWQTLTIGASVSDVAYLLGAAIDPNSSP